jgi:hypothetical protein
MDLGVLKDREALKRRPGLRQPTLARRRQLGKLGSLISSSSHRNRSPLIAVWEADNFQAILTGSGRGSQAFAWLSRVDRAKSIEELMECDMEFMTYELKLVAAVKAAFAKNTELVLNIDHLVEGQRRLHKCASGPSVYWLALQTFARDDHEKYNELNVDLQLATLRGESDLAPWRERFRHMEESLHNLVKDPPLLESMKPTHVLLQVRGLKSMEELLKIFDRAIDDVAIRNSTWLLEEVAEVVEATNLVAARAAKVRDMKQRAGLSAKSKPGMPAASGTPGAWLSKSAQQRAKKALSKVSALTAAAPAITSLQLQAMVKAVAAKAAAVSQAAQAKSLATANALAAAKGKGKGKKGGKRGKKGKTLAPAPGSGGAGSASKPHAKGSGTPPVWVPADQWRQKPCFYWSVGGYCEKEAMCSWSHEASNRARGFVPGKGKAKGKGKGKAMPAVSWWEQPLEADSSVECLVDGIAVSGQMPIGLPSQRQTQRPSLSQEVKRTSTQQYPWLAPRASSSSTSRTTRPGGPASPVRLASPWPHRLW